MSGGMRGLGPSFPRSHSTRRAVSVESPGDVSMSASQDGSGAAIPLVVARRRRGWAALAIVVGLVIGAGMAAMRARKGPDARAAAQPPTALAIPAPGGAPPGFAPPPLGSTSPDGANLGDSQPSIASPSTSLHAAHPAPTAC